MQLPLLCLFLLISFSLSYGQLSELDRRNGFRDFTLGDPYEKWQSNVEQSSDLRGKINFHRYTGDCCTDLFGLPIVAINLGFVEEKLTSIEIVTEQIQKGYDKSGIRATFKGFASAGEAYRLYATINNLFGQPTSADVRELDGVSVALMQWAGKKVVLDLEYRYFGMNKGDQIFLFVNSRNLYPTPDDF